MFDTMTLTKVVAGFCAALLIFVVANRVAGSMYGMREVHHVGEEHHEQGYMIAVAEDGHAEAEVVEEGPPFEEVFASADAAAGEGLWRNCRSCHALEEGKNGTGPSLFGLVGRPIDSIDGFNYSGALAQLGDTWVPEALNAFLENPKAAAPGTAMNFRGLGDVQDRANLIAYLQSVGG